MKNRFVTLAAAFLVLASCKPAAEAPPKASKADEFKKATLAQAKASFNKMFKGDLNEGSVKVMTAQDLDKWIKGGPWGTRELPCEIKDILAGADRGNVDPSPIALDVSGSAPKAGTHLVYIPVRSKVNCSSPKSDFFLDDVAECKNEEKVMVCKGGIGTTCTCSCIFVCNAAETLCNPSCS
jgi:hypothetical protein